MGILRTNRISGLETPTPVTGSVSFDGDGDYLRIDSTSDFAFGTGDFTMECWYYPTGGSLEWLMDCRNVATSQLGPAVYTAGTTIRVFINGNVRIDGPRPPANQWYHVALCRSGTSTKLFVNGNQVGSTYTDTNNYVSTNVRIGANEQNPPTIYGTQYSSNVRILKGTALYTADFTPPVHELQRIGDTVLLCCNNPDSARAEATGKTITVNGNAAASTFSPGLTRDFTYGTQFSGVTKFDTQGYFVPPSGTTEQRSRGRGVFGGGYTFTNTIDYISIQSQGNAQDFGDLTVTRYNTGSCSSFVRGLFGGGFSVVYAYQNTIDYITISTTSNALDFGDLTVSREAPTGSTSNQIRGLWSGGSIPGQYYNVIDYVNIASIGNALDFGDLSIARTSLSACSSPTRGLFGGGYSFTNIIDYVTITSTGNSQDFGDLTVARSAGSGCSSQIRGIFAGGTTPVYTNIIDYVTIASTGNAVDFGDLIIPIAANGACSSSIRGVFAGGQTPTPVYVNNIEYINISTTGNSIDFGDRTVSKTAVAGCSDSHGGLS
jgi:hypothetical protein